MRHATETRDDAAEFRRFAKTMRALIAVPKSELDNKLAENKAEKRSRGRGKKDAQVR